MIAYIKRSGDFSTVYHGNAESWSIPVATASDETGSVRLPFAETWDPAGSWLYLAGHLFLIDKAAPKNGMTDLTVADPSAAFSRQLLWPDTAPETYGAFIKDALEREYINCTDEAYRVAYLTVTNTDSTPLIVPELDDTKRYTLSDIIAAARRAGVLVEYRITGKKLAVEISTARGRVHNITFTDGHDKLEEETYSRAITAKVTVMQEVEPAEGEEKPEHKTYTLSTWYLAADGSVSDTAPAERAAGGWEYITCKADEDPRQKAQEVFDGNISSHKIEFYSDREYKLWDTVRMRLSGGVFTSSITSIVQSSKDSRTRYRCGDLATTLTEKVRRASS